MSLINAIIAKIVLFFSILLGIRKRTVLVANNLYYLDPVDQKLLLDLKLTRRRYRLLDENLVDGKVRVVGPENVTNDLTIPEIVNKIGAKRIIFSKDEKIRDYDAYCEDDCYTYLWQPEYRYPSSLEKPKA